MKTLEDLEAHVEAEAKAEGPEAEAHLQSERDRFRLVAQQVMICGVDEVGTGCLAGPVFAAVCSLPKDWVDKGVKDSKLLTESRREYLYGYLTESTMWCVGEASVDEINTLNILQASFLAMRRALAGFVEKYGEPDLVLVDGKNRIPKITLKQQTVVKGDQKHLEIGAASILAKVTRDRRMLGIATVYPGYDLQNNKGYGAPKHLQGLATLGATPIHRYYALSAGQKKKEKAVVSTPPVASVARQHDAEVTEWFHVDLEGVPNE